MNLTSCFTILRLSLLPLACLLGLQACSFLPPNTRESAASLPQGEFHIATSMAPGVGISAAYGVNDHWDVGLDVGLQNDLDPRSSPNLWTRYTFPNQAKGTEVALTAGVFKTGLDNYYYDDNQNYYDTEVITGFYAGGIYSLDLERSSKLNLAYQYNALYYDGFQFDSGSYLGGNFLEGQGLSNVNISDQDLSGIGKLTATVSITIKPQAHVHFGVSCLLFHTANNTALESSFCSPVAGLTFYRR